MPALCLLAKGLSLRARFGMPAPCGGELIRQAGRRSAVGWSEGRGPTNGRTNEKHQKIAFVLVCPHPIEASDFIKSRMRLRCCVGLS
jgi:hypothetical protein